jgi:hypothetical protein
MTGWLCIALMISARLSGAAWSEIALMISALIVFVLLPGASLRRRMGLFEDGAAMRAFGTLSLGLCVSIASLLLARVLQAPWISALVPLSLLVLWKPRSTDARAEPGPGSLAVIVVVGLCVARGLVFAPDSFSPAPGSDAHFHAGNVGQLLQHWPALDPRVAGEEFRYHMFSYAPAASLAQWLDLPCYRVLYALTQSLFPLGIALGMLALGTALCGRTSGGLVAALAVVLFEDAGRVLGAWSSTPLATDSWLAFGVHSSPSSSLSLCLCIAVLCVWRDLLRPERSAGQAWLALLLFGAVLSGTKGSTVPVLGAGLAISTLGRMVAARRANVRTIVGGLGLVLGALPMSLYLVGGEQNYAAAMLRWAPLAEFRSTPLASAHGTGAVEIALALLLFFGVSWVGLLAGRRAQPDLRHELGGLFAVALIAVLGMSAPGDSHLFFVYPGQLALALLLGIAVTPSSAQARAGWAWLTTALLVLVAQATTLASLHSRRGHEPSAQERLHRAGQDWMRRELPKDAVLVVENRLKLHSVHSEREVYYETDGFTAGKLSGEAPATGPDGKAICSLPQQRNLASVSFLARPSPSTLERLRKLAPAGRPLYAVLDSGSALALPSAQEVFANEAIRVYRLPD